MNVGFIGTGSMGTILVESFLESQALSPQQISIFNRTPEKADKLAYRYPGMHVANSIEELAASCDRIFICVRPVDYRSVLDVFATCLTQEQVIISITSSVRLSDLERWLSCRVIKMIPSITNAALSGATLLTFGSRFDSESRKKWFDFFSTISHPIEIDEQYVRVSSDITSCGPAFFSFLIEKFIQMATKETGISKENATLLATHMITGLGELFTTGKFTLESLQSRVCVPGGVTGVGLAVLEEELGPLFQHVFQKTHEKFEKDLEESAIWLR